ncbi:MAG: T9SS type A sorting domain-containing protein [Flavobacteriales bacterium]|jgi:hypothetical protein|nr:T9SS type A sorting domain-containing protein [Flavobacteriales bacterium]
MDQLFRSVSLTTALVLGTMVFAQPIPPYDITVAGYISGCNPSGTNYVNIITQQGTQPSVDIDVPVDANCGFSVTLSMDSYQGWFMISTPCNGAIQSATVAYEVNVLQPDSNYVFVVLNCGGGTVDCAGVPGGASLPGTPCDDNDGWTILDTWTAGCECVGLDSMFYDCLGIEGGPNTFGTPCVQPATGLSGYWSNNCVCVADTATTECSANFWVMQAYTYGDSVINPGGGTEPIPNEVWVWNLTSGGQAPYTYLWSFGDGTSSTEGYPTHFYANGGPYQLCLTIADAEGCTSTYCDEVSIDENGIYTGLIVDGRPGMLRSGFTIRVITELPTGVDEHNAVEEVAMWPNPVEDIIGLSFTSSRSANLGLSIMDLNGRVIRTSNNAVSVGNNRHSISVADLDAGMYLLQITDGTQSTSRRFVKN